jgi:hypothetical protein
MGGFQSRLDPDRNERPYLKNKAASAGGRVLSGKASD